MVRRGVTAAAAAVLLLATACGRDMDMSDVAAEMPDTMPVMRALENASARDSMLDSMPGGEMARGDSAAAQRLLEDKLGR